MSTFLGPWMNVLLKTLEMEATYGWRMWMEDVDVEE